MSLSASPSAVVSHVVALLNQRPEVVTVIDSWSAHLAALIANNGRRALVVAEFKPLGAVEGE